MSSGSDMGSVRAFFQCNLKKPGPAFAGDPNVLGDGINGDAIEHIPTFIFVVENNLGDQLDFPFP